MSEPEAPATDTATATRGRPRPDATKARDEKVLAYLREQGPKNRKDIAAALEIPGNEVYLSLYRLSRGTTDAPASVVKDGSSWKAIDAPAAE
jgi:hypothetical protein